MGVGGPQQRRAAAWELVARQQRWWPAGETGWHQLVDHGSFDALSAGRGVKVAVAQMSPEEATRALGLLWDATVVGDLRLRRPHGPAHIGAFCALPLAVELRRIAGPSRDAERAEQLGVWAQALVAQVRLSSQRTLSGVIVALEAGFDLIAFQLAAYALVSLTAQVPKDMVVRLCDDGLSVDDALCAAALLEAAA